MTELLTAAQMRVIEQAAIDSGEVTGLELMERAGQGVVEAIFEEWPELGDALDDSGERGAAPRPSASPRGISAKKKRAVVLCGPGNNGGDGFVVARLLYERGWAVDVFLYGDAEKLPPDARVNYERWSELGEVRALTQNSLLRSDANLSGETPLVVDALFGTGLKRPVANELSQILSIASATDSFAFSKWVYVDICSGICSDSGKDLRYPQPPLPEGSLTVSFHSEKIGHRLCHLEDDRKAVKIAEIGLSPVNLPNTISRRALQQFHNQDQIGLVVCGLLDTLGTSYCEKFHNEHKFDHGHALIISGGPSQTGAARLAARGALRIGAGLVSLGVPASARQEAASQLTAIMLRKVQSAKDLMESLQDERINALCLGPALGLDRAKALVATALDGGIKARPTVLDADALSAFAADPDALFAMLHDKCVLTPHGGEFARLFPDISEKLNAVATKGPAYSKVDATREAAKRAGCVVLFKGAATVIAAPDGRCSINSAHYERSAPWLATAGSGDVLAGFITGLLARGFAPMQAAETAAWLHVECALKFGPGLIAEDIPEQLPAVFRDLGV